MFEMIVQYPLSESKRARILERGELDRQVSQLADLRAALQARPAPPADSN